MFLPQGGLAISVASTVWVGAVVVCVLNLCLGWSLTGLVIPGFLVPIFLIMPSVALINIIEGVLTYLLVKLISSALIHYEQLDRAFGREKFFAIIIISVVVKVIIDYGVLPPLADLLQHSYNYQFDYYTNLNSYGIIIVALIANQFWKEGLINSVIPMTITIGLTYLLVRYGLMEFSNFRISQIENLYSNLSEIFPSSAKSYIILIVATYIGIKMTTNYGWNYGGILVVGFLALQWYSPLRVLATLCESLVIYLVSTWLLSLNFIASHNIVHTKRILLFFNVGFLYRILLGDIVVNIFPEERIIEYYGFGYLLSTLIALQMHNSNSAIRSMFMVLWTSFWGFILGSSIALILYFVSGSFASKKIIKFNPVKIEQIAQVSRQSGYLIGLIEFYKQKMEETAKTPLIPPKPEEVLLLDKQLLTPLADIVLYSKEFNEQVEKQLGNINSYADLFGYELVLLDDLLSGDKFIFLVPKDSPKDDKSINKNWGMYVFRLNSYNDQIIQVPRPFDEVNSFSFATFLFQKMRAAFLFVGGTYSNVNQDRVADLTRPASKYSLYNAVNQVFLRQHNYTNLVMQIRGYSLSINSNSKPSHPVLIAFSDGAIRPEQLSKEQKEITKLMEEQNLDYSLVNGDEQTMDYEVGELFLSRYLVQTPNKDLAVIWLSPILRKSFVDPLNNYSLLSYYKALDIPVIHDSLTNFLKNAKITYDWQVPKDLEQLINSYLVTKDIVLLKSISQLEGYKFQYLILTDDGRDYLAILDEANNLFGLVSMKEQVEDDIYSIAAGEKPRDDLSLKRWIIFEK